MPPTAIPYIPLCGLVGLYPRHGGLGQSEMSQQLPHRKVEATTFYHVSAGNSPLYLWVHCAGKLYQHTAYVVGGRRRTQHLQVSEGLHVHYSISTD